MKSRTAITLGSLATLGLLALGFAIIPGSSPAQAAAPSGARIALLYIEGVITAEAPAEEIFPGMSGAGGASSIAVVRKLEEARKDKDIKAVVIRVNSPGGSAAGSHEIYTEIVKLKAEKPVYISMGDVAASGGYYVSAPATKIYAVPSTLTGSIGVIMELPKFAELFDKIGMDIRTYKAGAHKDIGSVTRDMTPEEDAILQDLLSTTHEQFMKAVDDGRANLDLAQVRALADGTIWTGEDALAKGLVDELGGLKDVLDFAAKTANLNPDDYVVDELSTSFWDDLLEQLELRGPTGPMGRLQGLFGALLMGQGAGGAELIALQLAQQQAAMQAPLMPRTESGIGAIANSLYLNQALASGLALRY